MTSLPTLIAPALATSFGVGVLAFQIVGTRRAWATLDWPKCQGTISHSAVEATGVRQSTGRASVSLYNPAISYHYVVQGRGYAGRVVSYKGVVGSLSSAEDLVARFPDGAKVDVWYNPKDPKVAVLDPGAGGSNYIGMAAGGAFIAGGVLWILLKVLAA